MQQTLVNMYTRPGPRNYYVLSGNRINRNNLHVLLSGVCAGITFCTPNLELGIIRVHTNESLIYMKWLIIKNRSCPPPKIYLIHGHLNHNCCPSVCILVYLYVCHR